MTLDEDKLQAFVGQLAGDLGAVAHAATVLVGHQLGLYKAMSDSTWITAEELASATGTDARYVDEWLAAQAASGYAEYDATTQRFRLPPEQALVLADEHNPVVFAPGGAQLAASMIKDVDLVADAFTTGEGVAWGDHHHDLFPGTEAFFRPQYIGQLTSSWIPALAGVQAKLEAGARVADIGCGHGASTVIMAQAFPSSAFVGFDPHPESITAARKTAADAGVTERVTFEVATAKDYPGGGYDLVCFFDCLHDMGDPVGALAHTREALAEGGTVMLVEPYAADSLEGNLTPVGRVYYAGSTMLCTPSSRSQEVGAALGAQAGEARIREVAAAAGFTQFRRATETPFNLVLEASG